MSQDPIGDGVNWYAYVGGNRVIRVDPRGLDDIYLYGEGEMAIGPAADLSAGIVYDTDHPDESGIFGSMGTGWGLNIGAGAGVGWAPRDIEGAWWGADYNIGLLSVVFMFDDKGWNGGAIGPNIPTPLPIGSHLIAPAITGTATWGDVKSLWGDLKMIWNARSLPRE